MKKTALFEAHKKLGAKIVDFAGYQMPLEYEGVIKEHMAVRKEAGLFDVSHMGEFWVKGPQALGLLQKVTSNDVSKLNIGQAQYSCLPNGKGGIVDDLIVYYFEENKYMVVVNAANEQKDWDWFNQHNTMGAELENASDKISLLALQGPKAKEILQPLCTFDLDDLKSFHFKVAKVGSSENVIVSATGYTGAGGFELYCYNQDAMELWNALMKTGGGLGIKPVGLAARDTLRLEMGYNLYGNDIDDSTSPIEAGLGWVVKLVEGKDCIDREFLSKQKEEGVSKIMIGIEMIDRGIPRKGYVIEDANGSEIGMVTSGTMSPMLNKGIGMAYIRTELAKPENEVYLRVRNKKLKAKVVKFPFI